MRHHEKSLREFQQKRRTGVVGEHGTQERLDFFLYGLVELAPGEFTRTASSVYAKALLEKGLAEDDHHHFRETGKLALLKKRRSLLFASFVAGQFQNEKSRASIIEALANVTKEIHGEGR